MKAAREFSPTRTLRATITEVPDGPRAIMSSKSRANFGRGFTIARASACYILRPRDFRGNIARGVRGCREMLGISRHIG